MFSLQEIASKVRSFFAVPPASEEEFQAGEAMDRWLIMSVICGANLISLEKHSDSGFVVPRAFSQKREAIQFAGISSSVLESLEREIQARCGAYEAFTFAFCTESGGKYIFHVKSAFEKSAEGNILRIELELIPATRSQSS